MGTESDENVKDLWATPQWENDATFIRIISLLGFILEASDIAIIWVFDGDMDETKYVTFVEWILVVLHKFSDVLGFWSNNGFIFGSTGCEFLGYNIVVPDVIIVVIDGLGIIWYLVGSFD